MQARVRQKSAVRKKRGRTLLRPLKTTRDKFSCWTSTSNCQKYTRCYFSRMSPVVGTWAEHQAVLHRRHLEVAQEWKGWAIGRRSVRHPKVSWPRGSPILGCTRFANLPADDSGNSNQVLSLVAALINGNITTSFRTSREAGQRRPLVLVRPAGATIIVTC